VEVVQKAFQMTLDDLGFEEAHNVMGCSDCRWEGRNVIYCIRSWHNRDHPYRVCHALIASLTYLSDQYYHRVSTPFLCLESLDISA